MLGILVIVILVGVVAGPLWIVMERIHHRAKVARTSGLPALVIGLVGWFVAVAAAVFTSFSLYITMFGDPRGSIVLAILTWSSAVGATVGAASGYVYLWARTTRDADFGGIEDLSNRE